MTKALRGWREQPDGTLRLSGFGWIAEPGIGHYGECTLNAPLPNTQRDWLLSFGKLIGSACKVDQCIANPRERISLNSRPCPVLCMFGWEIRCRRLEASERTRLRIARLELPTPPEMRWTAAKSFCEQIVEIVEERCIWLRERFVTHTQTTLNLPGEEQLACESNQICEQFEAVANRWNFEPINAREWMRLIELELSKCDWLTADEQTPKGTIPPAPKRYSSFREPQEWLRLRKLKGLSNHRNTWQPLVKKHGDDIDCESTKSVRISIELAKEWGLNLPEFETIHD